MNRRDFLRATLGLPGVAVLMATLGQLPRQDEVRVLHHTFTVGRESRPLEYLDYVGLTPEQTGEVERYLKSKWNV